MNSPVKLVWSRSTANFRGRVREWGAFFQAGFFMRGKETTAAQQADMATASKLQVAVDVNGGELRLFR